MFWYALFSLYINFPSTASPEIKHIASAYTLMATKNRLLMTLSAADIAANNAHIN